ncbi:MAG TPA: DUF167 domain-containing protein [Candidatus Thermoplasmatota archaeon]|jgi:hypothetical protein|nr:DUF167 domain-containing protein [Candidatus Thermoplasmatota archaeon]
MKPRMASLEDAVRESGDGIALNLEVQPGARSENFPAGFNPWRGRIQARVQAPAEDGQANEALRALVSEFFQVPNAQVQLAQGATNRQKTVVVQGVEWRTALARLREGLQAQQ